MTIVYQQCFGIQHDNYGPRIKKYYIHFVFFSHTEVATGNTKMLTDLLYERCNKSISLHSKREY